MGNPDENLLASIQGITKFLQVCPRCGVPIEDVIQEQRQHNVMEGGDFTEIQQVTDFYTRIGDLMVEHFQKAHPGPEADEMARVSKEVSAWMQANTPKD